MNPWHDKISNVIQLGGIETSVLDNGPGRGTRIAWFNTGSPLRYKIIIDRGLDIADAFYAHQSLAWMSHHGTIAPDLAANKDTEWLRSFGGGLLTTCGLSNIGPPEADGSEGLHGRISNTRAEIISIQQPDPERGITQMSITALLRESSVFGPHLELRRTVSSELGASHITLHDEVTNRGNTPAPHMLLYHCNLGWPLIDEGTQLHWLGETRSRSVVKGDDLTFHPDNDFKTCPAPMAAHSGNGEAAAFITSEADPDGLCRASAFNPKNNLRLTLAFNPKQLPHLTNWQHWGPKEYITALEPCTHLPLGQTAAREAGTLIMLEPGETRTYNLTLRINQES